MTRLEIENGLPPVLVETVRRGQGVLLMSGSRGSGLDGTVEALLKASGSRWVMLESGGVPADADGVLLAHDPTPDALRRFLTAVEEGRVGLLKMGAPSAFTAYRRLLSLDLGEGRRHFIARMAEQMTLLSGQMRVRSLDGSRAEEAREIVLVTPPLQQALAREDMEMADQLLKSGDESSGTVSFNQNLLQLLLRRRIDIKAAFEATRDPAHLDQILKKVGI